MNDENVGKIRSNEDKSLLKHLFEEGYSIERLAELFGRTKKGIAYRLQYMGLIDDAEEYLKQLSKPEIKESSITENFEHTLEMETFKALKIKRLKLAKNKPAYMVCEDYTLHFIAENRPLTRGQMMNIPGIKDTKFDRYGEEFIKTIKAVLSYYDNHYFNIKTKRHADTGGFYNSRGFNIDGINKDTGTKRDLQGFDIDGYHKDTGTKFNLKGYDINGDRDIDPVEEMMKKKARDDEIRKYLDTPNIFD